MKTQCTAPLAQWIEHWTSDPGVMGSTPIWCTFFELLVLLSMVHNNATSGGTLIDYLTALWPPVKVSDPVKPNIKPGQAAVKTNDQAVWSKHIKKSLKLDRALTELDSLDQRGSNSHLTTTRKSKVGEEFQRQLTIQINNTIQYKYLQLTKKQFIVKQFNVQFSDQRTETSPATTNQLDDLSTMWVCLATLLNRSGIAFGGERHTTGPSGELVERAPIGT